MAAPPSPTKVQQDAVFALAEAQRDAGNPQFGTILDEVGRILHLAEQSAQRQLAEAHAETEALRREVTRLTDRRVTPLATASGGRPTPLSPYRSPATAAAAAGHRTLGGRAQPRRRRASAPRAAESSRGEEIWNLLCDGKIDSLGQKDLFALRSYLRASIQEKGVKITRFSPSALGTNEHHTAAEIVEINAHREVLQDALRNTDTLMKPL